MWRQSRREYRLTWGHQGRIRGSCLTADGRLLAIFDHSGKILVSCLEHGEIADRPRAVFTTRYTDLNSTSFSANGRYLTTGVFQQEGPSGGLEVFDCQTVQRVLHRPLPAGTLIQSVAFHETDRQHVVITKSLDQFSITFHNLAEISAPPETRMLPRDVIFAILSPDAEKLCLQSGSGISLVNPVTGQLMAHMTGSQAKAAWGGGFSPDSRFLSIAIDHELLVWQTESGRLVKRLAMADPLIGFGWSSWGRYLTWGEDSGRVAILDTAAANVRELIPRSRDFKSIGFDPSYSSDEKLFTYNQRRIPGGQMPVKVWNLETGQVTARFPDRNEARGSSFIPGGRDILLCGGARFGIWKLDPPTEPDVLPGHLSEAWAAAFSPDGKILATASDDTSERATIRIWDPASGKQLAGWKGHASMVSALAFHPDGRTLASASLDSLPNGSPNLILWDAATQKPQANLLGHPGRIRAIAFSPDGRILASAGDDGNVRLWDVIARSVRATLAGHTGKVNSLAFSPDGRLLASASNDTTLRLWDVSSGQARAQFQDVRDVLAVRFAPDGSILASVNEQGQLKLWNTTENRLLRTIPGDPLELRARVHARLPGHCRSR